MIFKNLFKKKKWLSEKVSERLAAVAELSLSEPANKPIMHELAFNDQNDKVRRAALEKLNDFSLWWQAYKHDASDNIKKHAEKTVIDSLTGQGSVPVDHQLKSKFIAECNNSQLLEKVVFAIDDETLVLTVLNKLNKDSLYFKAITDSQLSAELKKQLIENTSELSQLKKLAKKLDNGPLDLVNDKIAFITEQAEKPIKIEKHLRLVLARLNALKEKNDFGVIQQQIEQISQEWQQSSSDLLLLPADTQTELEQKYTAINDSLGRILAPLKAEYEQQQALADAEKEMNHNRDELNLALDGIEGQIAQAIGQGEEIDQATVAEAINGVSKQCQEKVLSTSDKAALIARVESIFNRANQVPQIKQAIAEAAVIIDAVAKLEAPTDLATLNVVNPEFRALKKRWQETIDTASMAMPSDIAESYKTHLEHMQQPVWDLERQQKQLFNQCRRKLSELDGLVQRGRFHNAFGLFKKLSFWMADLNEYQQSQLAKKWQDAQSAIESLRDLERSFSNPKKQELLTDIKALAESPIADPTEQAHRVKLLRSNWQSLGHAGDETETTLNQEFDTLCEQAFAPCREHYQALEKERSDNLAAKELILSQLQTLNDNLNEAQVADWRELESVFVKLTKLWRETGLVDREKVDEINKRYRDLCTPVRKAINGHQSDNEALKRNLLKQAETIVASDQDLKEKIEQLKGLQAKWQKIGFAGKNADQKLWREFRTINNPVFAERDESFKQQKQESLALFEDFQDRLNELESRIEQCETITDHRGIIDDVGSVLSSLNGLAKGQYEKLKRSGSEIIKTSEEQIGQLRAQQEQQIFVDLFDAVTALAEGEKAEMSHLKPAWQTALNTNGRTDRHEVTLRLEILASIPSPDEDKVARNQIQMQLMSEKLEQGIEHSLQDQLEQWLASGPIEPSDLTLLNRIKPIFIS